MSNLILCGKCNIEKSVSEFNKYTRTIRGYQSYCKQCVKEYNHKNKYNITIQRKNYYIDNKSSLLQKQKVKRIQVRDKIKQNKQAILLLPTKICTKCKIEKLKTEYLSDKSKNDKLSSSCRSCKSKCNKDYNLRNPEIKKANRLKRKAIKKNANTGTVTNKVIKNLLDQTVCYYCKKYTEVKERSIEHKQPLSKGGLHDITNIVMSCLTCNLKKNNKTEKEFLEDIKQD